MTEEQPAQPSQYRCSGCAECIDLIEGRLEGLKILLDTPENKKTMSNIELKYAIEEIGIILECTKIISQQQEPVPKGISTCDVSIVQGSCPVCPQYLTCSHSDKRLIVDNTTIAAAAIRQEPAPDLLKQLKEAYCCQCSDELQNTCTGSPCILCEQIVKDHDAAIAAAAIKQERKRIREAVSKKSFLDNEGNVIVHSNEILAIIENGGK